MIRYLRFILIFLAAGLILSVILLSLVPPVSRDALVHHLAVPKLYLENGGIYEIPSMVFSYYPMNLDLLYMIPLYFGNDIIPKFIHFSFGLLTALLIFRYLRRKTDFTYALLGVILFLSVPIIVKLSITVYVDLGLICFSTGALLFLLEWIENRFRRKFLIASASMCGLALGTKYNSLIVLFLLTLFVPFLYARINRAEKKFFIRSAGHGLLYLLIALLVFSPWMLRNWYWKDNPIYPLYNKWFNPPAKIIERVTPDGDAPKSISVFSYRSIIYQETWWKIALLPLRIFFQGEDGSGRYFDGRLNPFLLILPFGAFFRTKEEEDEHIDREKKILLAFAILYFAFTFFRTVLRVRYLAPMIPPLVILSVFGVKNIFENLAGLRNRFLRQTGRGAVLTLLLFFLVLNAGYIHGQFRRVDPLSYLDGTLNRDEYITKYRPEYRAMEYINKELLSDARILFAFIGHRGYYCDREYLFDIDNNKSILGTLLRESESPDGMAAGLRNMGITHLLVRHDIFESWAKEEFKAEHLTILDMFFKHYLKMLFFYKGHGVFSLKELTQG